MKWTARDGLTGLHLAATQHYDLIVLDVMLPGMDGYALCQRLRESERRDTPVIMLTARDALDDRLRASAPAPTTTSQALRAARVGGAHRGGAQAHPRRRPAPAQRSLTSASTSTPSRSRPASRLGPIGLKLLAVLMQKSPAVATREALEAALWGDAPPTATYSLQPHPHLRQQVDKPFPKPLLHTVHGVGFRLAEQDKPE